jgi:nitrate reductase (cytochrome), electron transfer subunit
MDRRRTERVARDRSGGSGVRRTRPEESGGSRHGVLERVVMIGAAVLVMAGAVALMESGGGRRAEAGEGEPLLLRADDPIPSEAHAFRTRAADLASGVDTEPRPVAHPRTLQTFRSLRAFPGAPPRVPHGLSAEEFRGTLCNSCHERGGFSARFGTYVPVTPHPELVGCLQCHAVDDAVVGLELPTSAPDAHCRQCHAPAAAPAAPPFAGLDWRPAAWPRTGRQALPGGPPVVPHDLELRGDCLACHAGPAAVQEIRTTHPERTNCRQCHATLETDAGDFSRPAPRIRDP